MQERQALRCQDWLRQCPRMRQMLWIAPGWGCCHKPRRPNIKLMPSTRRAVRSLRHFGMRPKMVFADRPSGLSLRCCRASLVMKSRRSLEKGEYFDKYTERLMWRISRTNPIFMSRNNEAVGSRSINLRLHFDKSNPISQEVQAAPDSSSFRE